MATAVPHMAQSLTIGAFSVPLVLTPGVYIVNAVATNAGGNSAPTANRTITINPMPPTIVNPAQKYGDCIVARTSGSSR